MTVPHDIILVEKAIWKFQFSPGVNCRGFLKRAAQPSKALEMELVKKLSNMTFREGFLIFPPSK